MGRLPVWLIGLAVSGLLLQAADISGIWLGSGMTGGRRNQVQDIAFQFIQKGTTLTGKLYLDYGSTPLLQGTVDGDEIKFQVVAREQAGNEINKVVLRFTGTLQQGEMELTRERQEIRAAGNSGAGYARPGTQTFRLKRLP
jgi:hypothetical protein